MGEDIRFGFTDADTNGLDNGALAFDSAENTIGELNFETKEIETNHLVLDENETKLNLFPEETNEKIIPDYDSLISDCDKIFELNISKKIVNSPISIHFDFNKMDPLEAEKEATKIAKEAKLNATIYNYLKKHEFHDINIEILKDLEGFKELTPDEKITFIEKSILELSKNDCCVTDISLLKKLYKLKSIEELVQDSIEVDNIYFKQKEIKEKVITLINKYYSKMNLTENDSNNKNENINLLKEIDDKNNQITTLKDKLTEMVDPEIYQGKIEEVEKLEQEIENLKNQIEDLKNVSISDSTTEYNNEDELNNIEIDSKNEVAKPKSKTKLLVIIIGSILLFILGFFLIGSYLLSEEEPTNMNTNYATPVQKHTQVEPEVQPIKKIENEPKTVEVSPQNLQNAEIVYDFEKEISFDEFKMQKFDIYSDNYEKIRVNKRDFFRGDVINSYKLVRANSEGKILFVDKNSNPVWIEMK